MACQRCGTCCSSTFFALRDVPFDKDEREIGKWASYHGVEITRYAIDGVDYLGVKLPKPCQFLVDVEGKPSCAIYDMRPQICKQYLCAKAK